MKKKGRSASADAPHPLMLRVKKSSLSFQNGGLRGKASRLKEVFAPKYQKFDPFAVFHFPSNRSFAPPVATPLLTSVQK